MADSLDTELQMMWKRIYAQCQTIAQQEVLRLFGSNVRGGALSPGAIQPGTSGQVLTTTSGGQTAWQASSGSGLELTDGITDLTGITKMTVSGGTVGGTSPDATLTITGGGGAIQSAYYANSTTAWTVNAPEPTTLFPIDSLSVPLTVAASTTVLVFVSVHAQRAGALNCKLVDSGTGISDTYEFAVGPESNDVYSIWSGIYTLAAGSHTLAVGTAAAQNTNAVTFYERSLVVLVL